MLGEDGGEEKEEEEEKDFGDAGVGSAEAWACEGKRKWQETLAWRYNSFNRFPINTHDFIMFSSFQNPVGLQRVK